MKLFDFFAADDDEVERALFRELAPPPGAAAFSRRRGEVARAQASRASRGARHTL